MRVHSPPLLERYIDSLRLKFMKAFYRHASNFPTSAQLSNITQHFQNKKKKIITSWSSGVFLFPVAAAVCLEKVDKMLQTMTANKLQLSFQTTLTKANIHKINRDVIKKVWLVCIKACGWPCSR